MTTAEDQFLVRWLGSAGVYFDPRFFWVSSGETIPDGADLGSLDPHDWDVEHLAVFPNLSATNPNAAFVADCEKRFGTDSEFARTITEAADFLIRESQEKSCFAYDWEPGL